MSPEESKEIINGLLADKALQADKRLQNELLLRHMVTALQSAGELLEVQAGGEGRVPAFLDSAAGKLCLITPGSPAARQLLKQWFGWPAHFQWEEKLGMDLDGSGLPLRALHRLSHYDATRHLLFLMSGAAVSYASTARGGSLAMSTAPRAFYSWRPQNPRT